MLEIRCDWESQIPDYMQLLDTAVEAGMLRGAEQIAEIARDLVQKDTGSLHDSIDVEAVSLGVSINAGNLAGGYKGGSFQNDRPSGAPIDYALDQEYGLSNEQPHPFMTPAAEQAQAFVPEVVAEEIAMVSGG